MQAARSSKSSPLESCGKQPICLPILTLIASGLCMVAQGLRAEPLNSTTRRNSPAKLNKTSHRVAGKSL